VVRRLGDDETARLQAQPLTYAPVGEEVTGPPPGYGWLEKSRVLRRRDLDGAARDLFAWQVQERSGLQVAASDVPLREGTVVVLRLGPGRLSLRIPCRVVRVVDEPGQAGFVYGTLPGHPEQGEEAFWLRRGDDGAITLTITAFSRPGTLLTRLGGPAATAFQGFMTTRYLGALDRG
jgi:uncharacterized protein (UPF0548 family)